MNEDMIKLIYDMGKELSTLRDKVKELSKPEIYIINVDFSNNIESDNIIAVVKRISELLASKIGDRFIIVPSINNEINIKCLNKDDIVIKVNEDNITVDDILDIINKREGNLG